MLTTKFDTYPEVMRIPYPPVLTERERNYGFVDLRGRPELAASIKEAQPSPALQRLLAQLAQKDSPLISLGCHLTEMKVPRSDRHAARGYIQFASSDYLGRVPLEYKAIAELIEKSVRPQSNSYLWDLTFLLAPASIHFDGGSEVVPTVWIWFGAKGITEKVAVRSRECLIDAVRAGLAPSGVMTAIASALSPRSPPSLDR